MKSMEKIARKLQDSIIEDAKEIYSEKALQAMMAPQNVGEIKDADAEAMTRGICGDRMRIYLKFKEGRIERATFLTDGCGTSIACGSMATQLATGKSIREAMDISPADILDELDGLPNSHIHCSILAAITLQKAIAKYLLRKEGMGEDARF